MGVSAPKGANIPPNQITGVWGNGSANPPTHHYWTLTIGGTIPRGFPESPRQLGVGELTRPLTVSFGVGNGEWVCDLVLTEEEGRRFQRQ